MEENLSTTELIEKQFLNFVNYYVERERIELEPFTKETLISDLDLSAKFQLDSLDSLDFIMQVEREFDVFFNDSDSEKMVMHLSVESVLEMIKKYVTK